MGHFCPLILNFIGILNDFNKLNYALNVRTLNVLSQLSYSVCVYSLGVFLFVFCDILDNVKSHIVYTTVTILSYTISHTTI